MHDVIKEAKTEYEKIISWFRGEIASLRTGRATPVLVEDIEVDMYGTKSKLKHVASISTPDSKTIVIQPWDKSALQSIGTAIEHTNLNLRPVVDSDVVRISLPQLTAERRKDLIKILNEKAEEARVSSRHIRDEALKAIEKMEKEKQISEDEKFRSKQDLQKGIDAFNASIQEIRDKKEQEIEEV